MEASPTPTFVTVESFTSPWEAHIGRGLLESEGIPALLAGEHHVWANWPLSQALGGVRLQVQACDAERARDVLQALRNGEYEVTLQEELALKAPQCPRCGSTDIQLYRRASSRAFSLLVGLIANAPYPPQVAGSRCGDCGYTFKGEP